MHVCVHVCVRKDIRERVKGEREMQGSILSRQMVCYYQTGREQDTQQRVEREKVMDREAKRVTSPEEERKEETKEERGERWMDRSKVTGKRDK